MYNTGDAPRYLTAIGRGKTSRDAEKDLANLLTDKRIVCNSLDADEREVLLHEDVRVVA